MKVLVACEYSGTIRDKLAVIHGVEVTSCDLRKGEGIYTGLHYQGDVFDLRDEEYDLLIGHPYCTYNTLAGIRWFYHPEDTHLPAHERRRHPGYPDRMDNFRKGIEFFKGLWNFNAKYVCLENSKPHGLAIAEIGRPTQTVQPWQFGEGYTKGASLWLKGLPKLVPTHSKEDYEEIVAMCHMMPPGEEREKARSKTYDSIGEAMVRTWVPFVMNNIYGGTL